MDLIVTSPDGTVSSMDALNTTADLDKKMTITHAEELIAKLVKDNWMSEVRMLKHFRVLTNKQLKASVYPF